MDKGKAVACEKKKTVQINRITLLVKQTTTKKLVEKYNK